MNIVEMIDQTTGLVDVVENTRIKADFGIDAALVVAGYSSYGDYLSSSHWANIRSLWIASGYPTDCLGCGISAFQLHHLTYDRLGHESLLDLIPRCDRCHYRIHQICSHQLVFLQDFEKGLKLGDWDLTAVSDRLKRLKECREKYPNGEPSVRSRLIQRRILAECPKCYCRRWQESFVCHRCGETCKAILDWH